MKLNYSVFLINGLFVSKLSQPLHVRYNKKYYNQSFQCLDEFIGNKAVLRKQDC